MTCQWGCDNDCQTYGAHLRNKGLGFPGVFSTRTPGKKSGFGSRDAEKKNEAELDYYSALRRQGIQPAGTTWDKCEKADRKSNETGVAYEADNPYKHVKVEDHIG